MPSLIPVSATGDILPRYRGTPIEWLLRYHNLREPLPESSGTAQLLVGMCMDHRKDLTLPNEFAYVLRTAGGSLRGREFEISYAVAVGGVSTLALLAHTDCGMAHLTGKREAFIRGLVARGGWDEASAARQFAEHSARYEIGDPLRFVLSEAFRLQHLYPRLLVAPLMYTVEDDKLLQIADDH